MRAFLGCHAASPTAGRCARRRAGLLGCAPSTDTSPPEPVRKAPVFASPQGRGPARMVCTGQPSCTELVGTPYWDPGHLTRDLPSWPELPMATRGDRVNKARRHLT